MKNNLIVIDKIKTQIRKPNNIEVFPLSPTHRKELRKLRNDNISDLKTRVSFIKDEKLKEFEKKHAEFINKKISEEQNKITSLNNNWKQLLENICKLIKERKKFEDKFKIQYYSISNDYSAIPSLKIPDIRNYQRKYCINNNQSIKIIKEMFNEKYGTFFNEINEKISEINTLYEEAINFGDLNMVKELYYKFKDADGFLNQIQNLKVK